jgi:hypothetical protein
MTIDDADEIVHRMDVESDPSSMFIGVSRAQWPLMYHSKPTRYTARVLIPMSRNDDRIAC